MAKISSQLLPGGLICLVPCSGSSPKEPQFQQQLLQLAMPAQLRTVLLQPKQGVSLQLLQMTAQQGLPAQQQQMRLKQVIQ